jgi:predicted GNAT family N-acyltransferase
MAIKLYKLIPQHLREDLDSLKKTLLTQYPGLQLSIHKLMGKDELYLSKIIVPKDGRNEGIGTKVMIELCKYADQKKLVISLNPSEEFGGNGSKLKRFYKRFGFVENRGKYKNFEISEDMYRIPK